MQNLSESQAHPEVPINENFATLAALAVYGERQPATSGLTWGYYGGFWGGFEIDDGELDLAASDTNYVVVEVATGEISASTSDTNWNDATNYRRARKIDTGASTITSQEDHRAGPGGVHGGGSSTSGGAGSSTTALRAYAQTPRDAVFLAGSGVFRDPRIVGTGALTPDAIATITDNSAYNAWPTKAARLLDGRILQVYTTGNDHHGDNAGKAVGKLGIEELDGTITWGSEFDIFDHASKWTSGYGATQLSTGRIIVSIWVDTYSVDGTGRAGYVYSDDGGATWSALQDLHAASGFTSQSFAEAECVELPNGDVLIGVGGCDSGETYLTDAGYKVLRSTDGGDSFSLLSTPVASGGADAPVFESVLGLLSDGSLLLIHRVGVSSAAPHTMQRSTDGGETWGAVSTMSVSGYGKPSFVQLSTGTIVMATRQDTTKAAVLHASTDLGATWGSAVTLDGTEYESEYAAPFELRNGRILVVYGYQPTSSFSNCDIKSCMVDESTSRLGAPSVQIEAIQIACSDETTDLATGTATVTFRMPYAFTLTAIRASVTTAPTGAALIVDVNEGGASILSTKLSIDAGEKTSTTAATPPVISDDSLADDAEITVDIDQVGSSVAGAGLKLTLIGHKP